MSLLSIGHFARATRLSVKALRHYDAEGLLRPALVDEATGYRYYAPAQARQAVTIATLRQLDVSLAAIRALLAATEAERTALLSVERDRLAKEIADKRAALASVERMLGAQSLLPHTVRRVDVPARRVASLRFDADDATLEAETTGAIRRLLSALSTQGLSFEEPVGCYMFEPDETGRRSLEVFVGVPQGQPSSDETKFETQPASAAAATRHEGPYAQLGLAHAALFAWVHERRAMPRGPVTELYMNDPDEVGSADLVTELRLPFEA